MATLATFGIGDSTNGDAVTLPAAARSPEPQIRSVTSQTVASFVAPWSMTFLPDGRMLVTERTPMGETTGGLVVPDGLHLVTQAGRVSRPLAGVPDNAGLLDVVAGPHFTDDHHVYLSFVERDPVAARVGANVADTTVYPAGLAVMRGTLLLDPAGAERVVDAKVIWRQTPKIVSKPGSGEFGGRMTFSPDGTYLFVAAGDRQEFAVVQDMDNTLGKVVRLLLDGSIPPDNPYRGRPTAAPEIWTLGHRNPYGLAFDSAGTLWENEMGPKGGDELNAIAPTRNYGWPTVSYGDNYQGPTIPRPKPGDGFAMSAHYWTPVIAPSGMIFYTGDVFAGWRGDAIISGLQANGLVRVRVNGLAATEVQRIDLQARIRAVAEAPDGAIWVLEDTPTGRLRRLTPIL